MGRERELASLLAARDDAFGRSVFVHVVGEAGVDDLAEGAELLMAADDVDAMSAAVGLMGVGDLERGLELGRLAGELQTIGDVVDALEMPVLSAVLGDRGWRLQQIAVDVIIDTITRAPGEITLVTLGPLTNLASVLREQPGIPDQVRTVYWYSDADSQNDFNYTCDPASARILLESPFDLHSISANGKQLENLQGFLAGGYRS